MTDKKKDNEYLWLQEQLTNDMNQLKEDKPDVETRSSKSIETESMSKGHQDPKNTAYIREMNELQQALASEVSEHTSKKKTKANEADSQLSYDTIQVELPSKRTSSQKQNSHSEHQSIDKKQTNIETGSKEKAKIPVWVGILISCVFIALAAGIIVCGKNIGKTALTSMGLLIEDEEEENLDDLLPTPEATISVTPSVTPVITEEAEEPVITQDEVYNVLLIGLDNKEETSYADTIVVASMNVTDQTYHLTQIMRDVFVSIPGYGEEVITKAYNYGGGALLIETIEQNFGLKLEGYLSVEFESFVDIIDSMGGIKLTLTADEAEYLNTTNYISQKINRIMVEGTQIANGDQALGYCRIQEVPNDENLEKDFGRVTRAKKVLEQMFERMGKLSFGDLAYSMNEFLPYIRTNLTKEKFRNLLEKLSENEVTKVDSLCIPIQSLYSIEIFNEKTVYVPEIEKTEAEIHTAIFGESEKTE